MGKVLVLALCILGLIAVACGGGASPTAGVTPGAQQALEAASVAGAFNVDIKDFAHQDITVAAGTTVAWTNRDGVAHTTTEVSDTNIWDSFSLQPGQSFSFTFTKAGTFNYFCAIHPTMRATVTVTGQPTPTMTPTPAATLAGTVAPPVAAAGANLEIVDFSHRDLTVSAGTTITWTNADAVIHTTTSNDGLWDSGVLESGHTFDFTFTQAGSFAFFCAIHPTMKATITVTGPQEAQSTPTVMAAPTPTPTAQPAPTATSAPTPTPEQQPSPTAAAGDALAALTVKADMQNFKHQDLTLQAGTTVVWTNRDSVQHTVTSGSPSDPDAGSLFDSGSNQADWVVQGETYSFTFNQAGMFPYYCRVHGAAMSGTITVTPAQPAAVAPSPTPEPTPTLAPPPAPTATPTPTPEPTAASSDLTANADIQGFAHQDLTVQPGTTVVWTNLDGASHTTTAKEGQWDSGTLREGQSFSFTFTEAGVFSYFCAIHPFMTAEVTVNN